MSLHFQGGRQATGSAFLHFRPLKISEYSTSLVKVCEGLDISGDLSWEPGKIQPPIQHIADLAWHMNLMAMRAYFTLYVDKYPDEARIVFFLNR